MPGSQSTDHHRRNRTVHKKLKKICRRLNLQSYSAGWAKFYTPTDLIATREWVRTTLAAHSQPHTHTHTHTTPQLTTTHIDLTSPRMDACTWPILGACFPASSRHQSACRLVTTRVVLCGSIACALLTASVCVVRGACPFLSAVSKVRIWCGCCDPSL
jgi:hypothetical protein